MDDKAVSGVIVEVIIPVRIGDNNISLEGGGGLPPLPWVIQVACPVSLYMT